jgi:penicillin-binding protein 1C
MGNFTGETVIGKTGSSVPAAIARDALVFLQPAGSDFLRPDNWRLSRVCALSGMEPTDACLSAVSEYVRDSQSEPCTWHRLTDGRVEVVYPAEYQAWFTAVSRQGVLDYASQPLEIISPREGFVYLSSPGIGRDEIPAEVIGGNREQLRVTFDDRTFVVNRPFSFSLPRSAGAHILRVQNGDEEEEVTFFVER